MWDFRSAIPFERPDELAGKATLSPEEAAALPNVVARGDTVNIEEGFDEAILAELRNRGFTIQGGRGENSGIHIIRELEDGTLIGAADPRRDGIAAQP